MALAVNKDTNRDPKRPKRRLTDDELLQKFRQDEQGPFHFDRSIIPDGQEYQWIAHEVLGSTENNRYAASLRRGWEHVTYEDHPGHFAPPGKSGPVDIAGQFLMRLDAEDYAERRRYQGLRAKRQVQGMVAQMSEAPAGTGPRHGAQVSRTYEPATSFEE